MSPTAAAAAADAWRADSLGLDALQGVVAPLLLHAGQALGAALHAMLEVEHVRDVQLLTPIPLVVLSIPAIAARGVTPTPFVIRRRPVAVAIECDAAIAD